MDVEVSLQEHFYDDPAEVTIVQVKRNDPHSPYDSPHYEDYCRLHGIRGAARASQDAFIARGMNDNSAFGTVLVDAGNDSAHRLRRIICGRVAKYPGALLQNGLAHANALGFRTVTFALPDLMFVDRQLMVSGFGDEVGLRDVIKLQAGDPGNTIESLRIVVEYNTTLAHWLHVELGLNKI